MPNVKEQLKGIWGFLTSFVQGVGLFLKDHKTSIKNCSKKGFFPPEQKIDFGLFFVILQSRADLKEKTLTVRKEF